jgi:hypothetical protein
VEEGLNFRAQSAFDLGKQLHTFLENFLRDNPDIDAEALKKEARKLGLAQGLSRKQLDGARNRAERRQAMAGTIGYPCRGNSAKASRRATVRQAKRRGLIKEARDAHLKALEAKTNA